MDRGAWPATVHGVTKKAQEALQGQSQQKGHPGNLAFPSLPHIQETRSFSRAVENPREALPPGSTAHTRGR